MTRIIRTFPTFILALTVVTLIASCSWRKPPPHDTLVLALESAPKTIDPRYATDANGQRLGDLLFSSIVTFDDNLDIVGDAASDWSYKNKVYTFNLKPNIRFHNGELLTREDILFSFQEFLKGSSPFSASLKNIVKVEAQYDDSAKWLKLYLDKFNASLLYNMPVLKLLPKKIVSEVGDDFFKKPVGSGVYQFGSQDTHNIHLVAHTQYFGEKARTPKAQFKVIKDGNTRFQKTYKGKIDIVQGDLPYAKLQVFERSNRFNLIVQPGVSMNYILLNFRDELLGKKEVRYALFQGLNREDIINYTIEGFAEPASSVLPPNNPFFADDLKFTGLKDQEFQKVLSQLKGKKLTLKTSNSLKAIENGKIIAHQLRQLGVDVQLQSHEWGTFYEDIKKGNFQMATMKWVGVTDPDHYRSIFHSKQTPPGFNRGYYKNSKLDKLLELAAGIEDIDQRKKLYHDIQSMVFNDLPTIPLWYEKQIAVVHTRVKNYRLPATGGFKGIVQAYKEPHE